MTKKIDSLEDLANLCESLRENGNRIVLCHGVFDLFHIGHLRHFQTAKKHGDILIVSLTGDAYVNKGPGRPVFPSELRSELLASLDIIDYVAVVEDHSANPIIEAVKPHFYVKGGEYSNAASDITGKITVEIQLVEGFGGKVVYTDEITFSSSNLLNSHFNLLDKPVQVFLSKLKEDGAEAKIEKCFEDMSKLKVVIIGESIIDEYQYVSPMGKAAKEHIIAAHYSNEERFAGGVVAAANHIASLCGELEVVTLLGDDEPYASFVREQLDPSIKLTEIVRPNSPTVRKIRFVEPTYVRKLFEVCHMDDAPLSDELQKRLNRILLPKLREADVVLVCDFGHGFISSKTIDLLERDSKFLALNVQSNSANQGYNLVTRYRRANLLCIDAMEARLATQDKHSSLSSIVAEELPRRINCNSIIVTHGKSGCYTFDPVAREPVHVPAFKHTVVDTIGAGDAFFVMASLFSAVGADNRLAAFVGNVAGAVKVGVVGHRESITKLKMRRSIITLMK